MTDETVFPLEFVLQAVNGVLHQKGTSSGFKAVGTDTRSDLEGHLFIALRGGKFDAHSFLPQAVAAGASAVLVDRADSLKDVPDTVTQILVEDTLQALQDLAQAHRLKMAPFLLAVTGSNGKTSTKEFLHQILSRHHSALKSRGSFNNHWGVPMTLLELRPRHTHGVIEMGMNHPGEIRPLVKLAQPQVVACTNVGVAHQGNFASPEALAKAKEEIYGPQRGLKMRVFNLDNPWTASMKKHYVSEGKLLTFSQKDPNADVFFRVEALDQQAITLEGHLLGRAGKAEVPVFGLQHAENLACAAAMALACGLSAEQVWADLSHCRTTWGRGEWVSTETVSQVLFDAYNSNPDSFGALLENLKALHRPQGQRWWLVASDMLEMGGEAESAHRELGKKLAQLPWSGVLYLGEWGQALKESLGEGAEFWHLPSFDAEELKAVLQKNLSAGDLVVVKGSRGGRLERVVDLLGPKSWSSKIPGKP